MKKIDFSRFLIVIDKPSGPTSFQIVDFVKKHLGLNKASHVGTLDPKVTGVLPILLGRAAKLSRYFSKSDKEYIGIMRFHENISREETEKAIKNKFLGKILQLPPVKSNVRREIREREIKEFEILEQEEIDFLFRVKCQAGTYIRKLVHDLGMELGIGAHMAELRRTKAGIFSENDKEFANMYDFAKAADEYKRGNSEKLKNILIPIEIIEKIMKRQDIEDKEIVNKILHGSPFFKNYLKKIKKTTGWERGENIALFKENSLFGIIRIEKSEEEIEKAEDDELIAIPLTIFN